MRFALAIILGATIVAFVVQQNKDADTAQIASLTAANEELSHDLVARVEALEQRKPEVQSCPVPQTDLLSAARVAKLESNQLELTKQLGRLLTIVEDMKNQPKATEPPPKPKTRLQLAKEDAAASNQQLLLVFHQAGCAPCAKLESYLRSIQHTISDRYLVVTADVTDEDVQDFRIPSTPTAFIYDPRTRAWGRPLSGADVYALFSMKGKR